MKWLVILLLVLNGWYAWSHRDVLRAGPVIEAVPLAPSNSVNQLLMLSELKDGELSERVDRNTSPAPAAAPGANGYEVASGTATAGVSDQPAQPAAPAAVCLSFGPIESADSGDALLAWAKAQGGDAELRDRERRELSRFWIYFPPLPDRSSAIALVEEMRAKELSDIFIIPRGDMANAISLGVYSRKQSRDRRLADLARHGYEPAVAPRYKTERATWLDARFPPGFVLDQPGLSERFGAIEVSDIRCTSAPQGRV